MSRVSAEIRRYAELCTALVTRLGEVESGRTDTLLQSIVTVFPALPSRWEPQPEQPIAHLWACIAELSQVQPTASWLPTVIDLQVVPKAARLALLILRNAETFIEVANSHPNFAQKREAARRNVLTLAHTALFGIYLSAKSAGAAIDANQHDIARRALSQLTAPAVLDALGAGGRFVETCAWPCAAKAPPSTIVTASEPSLCVGIGASMLLSISGSLEVILKASPPLDYSSSMVEYLRGVVRIPQGAPEPVIRAMILAAMRNPELIARFQSAYARACEEPIRVLTAIRSSGALSALCSALLSAPPCPPVPVDSTALDMYTRSLTGALYVLYSGLEIADNFEGPCASHVTGMLAAPEVLRLQQAGMEQVVLSGDIRRALQHQQQPAAAQDASPAAAAASSTGDDTSVSEHSSSNNSSGSGGGSGSKAKARSTAAAALAAAAQASGCWALLQRHVLKNMRGPRGGPISLTDVYSRIIQAWSGGVRVHLPSHGPAFDRKSTANAVAAAARLLPPRPEAAALGARAVGVLLDRFERLRDPVDTMTSYNRFFNDSHNNPSRLIEAMESVQMVLDYRMLGTGGASGAAAERARLAELAGCLPDLLEAHGWILRAAASPGSLASQPVDRAVAPVERLFVRLAGIGDESPTGEPQLTETQAAWKMMGQAGQAECARRVRHTGLLSSVDALVRWVALKDGTGGANMRRLLRGCFVVAILAAAVIREQLLLLPSVAATAQTSAQQQKKAGKAGAKKAGKGTGVQGHGAAVATVMDAVPGGAAGVTAAAATAAPATAAARASSAGEAEEAWRPARELGALVTLVKIAQVEAEKLRSTPPAPPPPPAGPRSAAAAAAPPPPLPDYLRRYSPLWALTQVLVDAGLMDVGLPGLLEELQAAVETGGVVAGPAAEAALAEALEVLPELCAACCRAALPLLTLLMEQAAKHLEDQTAPSGPTSSSAARSSRTATTPAGDEGDDEDDQSPVDLLALTIRTRLSAQCVVAALERMPPAEIRAVQPNRTLAVLGRLLVCLAARASRQSDADGRAASGLLADTTPLLTQATLLLSSDEGLQAELIPGWLWPQPMPAWEPPEQSSQRSAPPTRAASASRSGAGGAPVSIALNMCALARVRAGVGEDPTPPNGGPIFNVAGEAGRGALAKVPWQEHKRHTAAVAEMARGLVVPWAELRKTVPAGHVARLGSGELRVGRGRRRLWPPVVLRLCGNPRCGNFGGGCEEELKPKHCGGCRAVRYCGVQCQRQHYGVEGGHKRECAALAAERAAERAAAEADAGVAAEAKAAVGAEGLTVAEA